MTEENNTSTDSISEEELPPPLDGFFGCFCGKVRVDVVQTDSSSWVPPTAAMCQCRDCYQFVDWVSLFRREQRPESSDRADALTEFAAPNNRQIYKSDAARLHGAEHLRGIRLRPDSPCVRYYSHCCGTPLMIDYPLAPFFLVYQHTIDASSASCWFRRLPPEVVLNHGSAPADAPPMPSDIPVREGLSVGFLSHVLARAVWGMVSGKKTCPISAALERVPVAIGLEGLDGERYV